MEDHTAALQSTDKHCLDLDQTLKPSKCVSFIYYGKKALSNATFLIEDGSSRNISNGLTKFLGQTLCHTLPATTNE